VPSTPTPLELVPTTPHPLPELEPASAVPDAFVLAMASDVADASLPE
jgi:hypothetical protein